MKQRFKRIPDKTLLRQRKSLLNYIAGLFDGEGCVYISKKKPNKKFGTINPTYSLGIEIASTYYPVIRFLKDNLGGLIVPGKGTSKCRAYWKWRVGSERALGILKMLVPFLIIKREEVLVAIEYQEGKEVNWDFSKGQTLESLARNEQYRLRLQELKKRVSIEGEYQEVINADSHD